MPQRTEMVNLTQVATQAGVSTATASRILNRGESALFAKATAQRVRDAAERMGYRPNLPMRGVLTGKTGTVGLVAPGCDQFHGQMIRGVHDELAEVGCALILSWPDEHVPSPDSNQELAHIHRLLDRRVDAVILRPTHDDASDVYFKEVWERRIPLVTLDRALPKVNCDFVGTDDLWGGRCAAEHLLGLGHRRLGHIAGPSGISTARLRREGFEAALGEAQPTVGPCQIVESPGFIPHLDDVLAMLAKPNRPTGLFLAGDQALPVVYGAAQRLGLRIPEDLSVVGFADMPVASHFQPQVTTLRQAPYAIGREGARIAIERINGPSRPRKPRHVRLKPELMVRGSTAPPPETDAPQGQPSVSRTV